MTRQKEVGKVKTLRWHQWRPQLPAWSSYVQHVSPATGYAAQQWLRVSQAGIVDADVNAAVLLFDRGEHGQNLFFVRQVALEWQQDSA